MAFTFTSDLTDAVDYVRFHSGDTVEAESLLSDELITSLVAVEGSNNAAVIAAIEYKIMRINQPDFQADWLRVSPAEAVKGLERTLTRKRAAFGLPAITATVKHVYRADSAATSEPDYTNGRP